LINGFGQVILKKQIDHQKGSIIETIRVSKNIVDENYRLEVTKPDKSKKLFKFDCKEFESRYFLPQ